MRRLALLLGVAVVAAGCGGGGSSSSSSAKPKTVTVALDFTPNPTHAPIYEAARHPSHGVAIKIQKPGSGPDSLKLVASGKVELGVLDIQDLAIAREQGTDLVAVAALVGRPLSALIAQPSVASPRDLAGKTVGVSGLPSDPAFVKAIVTHDGGDYSKVKQVTIGFAAVSRLLTKKVDAVPAFWNAEGVALRRAGLNVKEFKIEDYGAPPFPEVVLMTSRKTLTAHRAEIAGALDAIDDGLATTRAHPDDAVKLIAAAAETKDTGLVRAQLDAVLPAFAPGLRFNRAVLEQWADFDARVGLTPKRPDVAAGFDLTLRGAA
jgi:putative hydroxymethylpyrimidine transport system substrate-binding protein